MQFTKRSFKFQSSLKQSVIKMLRYVALSNRNCCRHFVQQRNWFCDKPEGAWQNKPIDSSRIRKKSQFYQQHKPKTEQNKATNITDSSIKNKEKILNPVTSASVDRPTPHFKDHQYSSTKSRFNENDNSYTFGPGTVPHETVGKSASVSQIGSPQHVRQTLMSLTDRHATMAPTPTIEEQFGLFFKGLISSVKNSGIFSRLITLSIVGLIIFGDYIDSFYFDKNKDANKLYSFLAGSGEESIMNSLKTGDIIVFQTPLFSFNFLNSIRAILRQFVCDQPYDHCGIIICNKHDSDFPYVLEINQNQWLGKRWVNKMKSHFSNDKSQHNNGSNIVGNLNLLKLTPFDERVITAREGTVFVRQISRVHVDPSINQMFSDWVDHYVSNEEHSQQNIDKVNQILKDNGGKRDTVLGLFKTLWLPGDNTMILRSHMKDLKRRIALHAFEIETQKNQKKQAAPNTGIIAHRLRKKTQQRIRNTDQLKQELTQMKLELQLKKDNLAKRLSKVNKKRKVASSEFVAKLWQEMGLLEKEPDGPAPQEIRPNHFSSTKLGMPLKGYAILGPVQYMRTIVEGKKINDGSRSFNTEEWGFVKKDPEFEPEFLPEFKPAN